MFERFTDRARRVVVLAQEEALLLDHDYIGTEHLLLGLVHERDGVAARALESLRIVLGDVRARVEETVGRGSGRTSGHIPFTPRAKEVLELSLREALQLGHSYIGTEHLLLGLIREGKGVAAQVLAAMGADLGTVRSTVVELLADLPAGEERVRPAGLGSEGSQRRFYRFLLDDESSPLVRALREHGVDPEAFGATLERLQDEDDAD